MSGNDVFAEITPAGNSSLALFAYNRHGFLLTLLGVHVDLDIQHNDGSQVTHTLLCHTQELGAILVELDALDGRRKFPGHEAFASLNVPELDGVVGRSGGEEGRCWVHVHSPDSSHMAGIGS
jgi:hypothetical protein